MKINRRQYLEHMIIFALRFDNIEFYFTYFSAIDEVKNNWV